MPLILTERLPLGRFVFDPDWTPVKGVHIHPLRYLANERSNDPNDYLEVLKVVPVAGVSVAITRGGGLFVRDRGQYPSRESYARLASVLNLLLCEFALQGLVSEPVTDLDIQDGRLIGKYAAIVGGHGTHAARTFGPLWLLSTRARDLGEGYSPGAATYWPPNCYWFTHDPGVIARLTGVPGAIQLQELSSTLPTVFVAAQYHAARHNLAETILSAWVVTEQVLSSLWDQHVSVQRDKSRGDLLRDSRTFTAAVRAEILLTAGKMQTETYSLVQRARKIRNDMAHRAVLGEDQAETCLNAMTAMIRSVGVSVDRLPGFMRSHGGSGGPVHPLEPSFPFD